MSPALAGGFITTALPGKPLCIHSFTNRPLLCDRCAETSQRSWDIKSTLNYESFQSRGPHAFLLSDRASPGRRLGLSELRTTASQAIKLRFERLFYLQESSSRLFWQLGTRLCGKHLSATVSQVISHNLQLFLRTRLGLHHPFRCRAFLQAGHPKEKRVRVSFSWCFESAAATSCQMLGAPFLRRWRYFSPPSSTPSRDLLTWVKEAILTYLHPCPQFC